MRHAATRTHIREFVAATQQPNFTRKVCLQQWKTPLCNATVALGDRRGNGRVKCAWRGHNALGEWRRLCWSSLDTLWCAACRKRLVLRNAPNFGHALEVLPRAQGEPRSPRSWAHWLLRQQPQQERVRIFQLCPTISTLRDFNRIHSVSARPGARDCFAAHANHRPLSGVKAGLCPAMGAFAASAHYRRLMLRTFSRRQLLSSSYLWYVLCG